MRRTFAVMLGITTACSLVLAGSVIGPAARAAANHTVTASAFTFQPPVVVIEQGDTITFRNAELIAAPHNLREVPQSSPTGSSRFQSSTISPGQSAAVAGVTGLAAGAYAFACSIHPFMAGTLVVV